VILGINRAITISINLVNHGEDELIPWKVFYRLEKPDFKYGHDWLISWKVFYRLEKHGFFGAN